MDLKIYIKVQFTLKVVYTKKTMIAIVYIGINIPRVLPPLGSGGCMPGPPIVGRMPVMGPVNSSIFCQDIFEM